VGGKLRAIVTHFVLQIGFDDFRSSFLPEHMKMHSVLVLDGIYKKN